VSTTNADLPEQDSSSDFWDKCLEDYENSYEDHCQGQLTRYLNTPTAMDIDSLADEYIGPDPARKKDKDHE
jgi:hypothetical protein